MIMKKLAIASLLVLSATSGTPLIALAQAGSVNTTYLQGYANSIIGIINGIFIPVIMAIAFLVFIWGVYKYFILGAANETEKMEGRKFALWGIIGFVVIFSVWGLVNVVVGTFNLPTGGNASSRGLNPPKL